MDLEVRKEGNTVYVLPEEDIHFDNYKDVEQAVLEQIDEGASEIVMDLTNVETLYSMTLGMFNTIANTVAKKNGSFALTNVNAEVRKVLKATRLDKIIAVK